MLAEDTIVMKLTVRKISPNKKLHSREHLLAEDLSQALAEPARFAAYLGIAKRYHESDLRGLMRRVLEKADLPVEARGKYFFAALRGFVPKIKAKKKKKAKRRIVKKVTNVMSSPQKRGSRFN